MSWKTIATLGVAAALGLLVTTPSARADLGEGVITAGLAAEACTGDCDEDGVVTVEELTGCVKIVGGSTLLSRCPLLDGDGNEQAQVDDLLAAVANALYGCPGSTDPIAGVYDISVESSGTGSSGLGLGTAQRDLRGELHLEMQLDLFTFISVSGPLDSNSVVATVNGTRIEQGDIAYDAIGTATIRIGSEEVEIAGELQSSRVGEPPVQITFVMQRPLRSTVRTYAGRYRFSFAASGSESDSFAVLPVETDMTGFGDCGPAAETNGSGAVLANYEAKTCVVSPSGRFRFVTDRNPVDGSSSLPLQLFGVLRPTTDMNGGGDFHLGIIPALEKQGRWVSERR